ncbi:hypothetical protein BH23BAC3_BH23BAC3_08930 [soil metagenome]
MKHNNNHEYFLKKTLIMNIERNFIYFMPKEYQNYQFKIIEGFAKPFLKMIVLSIYFYCK